MIHQKLIQPESIAVIGGSDNPHSPGGKILENLLKHDFTGHIYVVNPKKNKVKGLPTYKNVSELPDQVDLAIIAIAAKYVEDTIKILTEHKNTKAFIIISAGFSDTGEAGKQLEKRILEQIEKHDGSLLGPNNIGLINRHYAGVFTTPVPSLSPQGVDLISGSGATAVFIMETAMKSGLQFNSVWSVGNSAQIGIEEVLEYLDKQHDTQSPKIKLLYIESIQKPQKLLKHARSLKEKGCYIVAIKAGSSTAGSRAASSHTGALASSDTAVDALFEKAGIIRVYGRREMVDTAVVLFHGLPKGKNMAVVTHAGGPGVMLTDVLEKNGLQVPQLQNKAVQALKERLLPGSSLANPIDFLATGTAEHLDDILNTLTDEVKEIDAVAVIFGSPGLFQVYEVYDVLAKHIKRHKLPIYPILPSVINVADEIAYFHQKGLPGFSDEVLFGKALTNAYRQTNVPLTNLDDAHSERKALMELNDYQGYLPNEIIYELLQSYDFPVVPQAEFTDVTKALEFAKKHFPVVMKVVGPLHKSDVGGVRLGIKTQEAFKTHFEQLMLIDGAQAVMIQAQKQGQELFIGVKKEAGFGHLILFGMGGIFIEVLKDFKTVLAPVNKSFILSKIQSLQSYPILKGIRGKQSIDIDTFADLIVKVSDLLTAYPEITEMDLNPVLADERGYYLVDARVKIS